MVLIPHLDLKSVSIPKTVSAIATGNGGQITGAEAGFNTENGKCYCNY